jgi:hypothetical protein
VRSPSEASDAVAPTDAPRALDDARALTVLTTEHWSLLSARGLVYNEAFARGGMFLSFLSATLVALGLVSTGTGFSSEFLVVAAAVLALDLFIGIATMGRVAAATSEDVRYLQGMNRLRHAYHEAVPGLERYFVSSAHDDALGVLAAYGGGDPTLRSAPSIWHGFTTTTGMIGVIVSALAAVLAGDLALLAGLAGPSAVVVAIVLFGLALGTNVSYMIRGIRAATEAIEPLFPTPGPPGASADR